MSPSCDPVLDPYRKWCSRYWKAQTVIQDGKVFWPSWAKERFPNSPILPPIVIATKDNTLAKRMVRSMFSDGSKDWSCIVSCNKAEFQEGNCWTKCQSSHSKAGQKPKPGQKPQGLEIHAQNINPQFNKCTYFPLQSMWDTTNKLHKTWLWKASNLWDRLQQTSWIS